MPFVESKPLICRLRGFVLTDQKPSSWAASGQGILDLQMFSVGSFMSPPDPLSQGVLYKENKGSAVSYHAVKAILYREAVR